MSEEPLIHSRRRPCREHESCEIVDRYGQRLHIHVGAPPGRGEEPLIESEFCNHRWRAPRGDAPLSVDVEHVCALPTDHRTPHWCPCQAYVDG